MDLAIYFDEQVLSHQAPEVRQFLLESSLLEEFDSAMCQEVLGSLHPAAQPDWKNLVETVRRATSSACRSDPRGRWLRYHHLFQEFLKARLQDEQPEQAGWIIRRLAGYHNAHLNWEAAYRIYKQLGDQGEILALIERSGSAMIASDRIITLGGWLQDLPDGSLEQRPILASLAGTVKLIQGELQPAVSLLDQAVGALSLDSDPLQLALALARRANVQRLLGKYAESLEDAESAMQILRPDGGHPEIYAVALRMKGLCHFRLGQTRQAVESLEQALQLLVRNQDEKGIPPAQIDLGMAYRALGDHDQARSLYMQALEALRRQGNLTWQSNLLNSLEVLLGLDGDYEQAVRRLEEAMDLSRRSGDAHTQALAYASLGDIYEEIEDLELADQAHSNTESYARQTNSRFLLHYSLLAKARIARRMAHFPRATSLLEELRLPIGQSNSNFEQGLYELEWGRLYLCSGDPRSALPPLERAVQAFERGELTLERGISLLWLTAARLQGSEPASAAQAFELLLPVLGQKQYQHVLGMTAFQVHGWLDRLESSAQIRRQIEPFFQHAKLVRAGFPTLRKRIRRMSGSIPVLPARMRINTLGKAQVYINGRLVTNAQWKTRAVRELFFFMLSASRPMKKEEIGAVLWPEVTDDVLRLRFKNNMYRLRNATSQNVILYGNELYAFNHELNPSYDLEAFRSTLERARRESDIAEQIRHYRTAVDLVRGRYLEDFDSTWVLSGARTPRAGIPGRVDLARPAAVQGRQPVPGPDHLSESACLGRLLRGGAPPDDGDPRRIRGSHRPGKAVPGPGRDPDAGAGCLPIRGDRKPVPDPRHLSLDSLPNTDQPQTSLVFLFLEPVLEPVLEPGMRYVKSHCHPPIQPNYRKGYVMKTKLFQITSLFQKVDRRHIQVVLSLLALVLFVLGAGAPDDGSHIGR